MCKGGRYFICVSLIVLYSISSVRAGPYEEGAAANKRGEYSAAIKHWRPLALQGDVNAQFALAMMYDLGRGVEKDRHEALKWFRFAAEKGHVASQFQLGSFYTSGEFVPQDKVEAAKWVQRAAEQGDPISQLMLGGIYAQGIGRAIDFVEALKWLIIASNSKTVNAISGFSGNIEDIGLMRAMTASQISEAKRRASEWKPKAERNP